VSGADPAVIASGPTVPQPLEPDLAIATMLSLGIDVPDLVREAVRRPRSPLPEPGPVTVIADGGTAAAAVVEAARSAGLAARSHDRWLGGDLAGALTRLFDTAQPGLTIAVGEVALEVTGSGIGGRNTHAALLAASMLAGTGSVFCAFATDGVDGKSGSAGAIVDATTVTRGGDPGRALADFDSATYLRSTGDLVETGPTGTNVSDLWILWK
jgi:glycerate 2-kinase